MVSSPVAGSAHSPLKPCEPGLNSVLPSVSWSYKLPSKWPIYLCSIAFKGFILHENHCQWLKNDIVMFIRAMTSLLKTNFLYQLEVREVTVAGAWGGLSNGIQKGSSKEQMVMLDQPFSFKCSSEPQPTEWCYPLRAVHNPCQGMIPPYLWRVFPLKLIKSRLSIRHPQGRTQSR